LSLFNLSFSVKINDVISVEISSTKPLPYINCLLSSRGKLIFSARKSVTNLYAFRITFPATFDMVPSGKFIAYYLESDGDLVSTTVDIPVTGLNNFVMNIKKNFGSKRFSNLSFIG